MTENQYQGKLIKKLELRFPGCIVLKNDADLVQGIPDLTILYEQYWAALEVKASPRARRQPNQDFYVQKLDDMSFAAYIDPENEEEVLSALSQAFKSPRRARVPQS